MAEFNEESVHGEFDLIVFGATFLLCFCYGVVDEFLIVFFLGCCEDQRRVGGCILWFVHVDGLEITRVGNDDGSSLFEMIERSSHSGFYT